MQKHFFYDDYSEGAHPRILAALGSTNLRQEHTYGTDSYSVQAEQLIQHEIGQTQAKVYFVASGTHANIVSLACMLKPYESIIAAETAHIYFHEAGAIEATGHRIHCLPTTNGKITPAAIQQIVDTHTDEHMVEPRVVAISQQTEVGTIYSKQELANVATVCQKNKLYLYLDGARLSHALMAKTADFTLSDIANYCDIFNLGGTKNGGLMGEAVVVVNPTLQDHFKYYLRQRGALLAKSRSVSEQFVEFFKDGLYFANAKHSNAMASLLADGIAARGYSFINPPVGNQLFPILPDTVITALESLYGFYPWPSQQQSNFSAIRLVTAWATPETAVQDFLRDLSLFSKL